MPTEYVEVTQTAPVTIEVTVASQDDDIYVGPTAPTFTRPGVWVQTGLGPSGDDYTIWFEDGQ